MENNDTTSGYVYDVDTGSQFRRFCEEKWQEHLIEKEAYGEKVDYSRADYFNQYKYWLKYQFKGL